MEDYINEIQPPELDLHRDTLAGKIAIMAAQGITDEKQIENFINNYYSGKPPHIEPKKQEIPEGLRPYMIQHKHL